ncbi:hypothetical protein RN001_011543, partial [Aquatica leii]
MKSVGEEDQQFTARERDTPSSIGSRRADPESVENEVAGNTDVPPLRAGRYVESTSSVKNRGIGEYFSSTPETEETEAKQERLERRPKTLIFIFNWDRRCYFSVHLIKLERINSSLCYRRLIAFE